MSGELLKSVYVVENRLRRVKIMVAKQEKIMEIPALIHAQNRCPASSAAAFEFSALPDNTL